MKCTSCSSFDKVNVKCRKWDKDLNQEDIDKACDEHAYRDDEDDDDY